MADVWSQTPGNIGHGYSVRARTGVPATAPVWRCARIVDGVMDGICLDGQRLYLFGARRMAAIAVETGEIAWVRDDESNRGYGAALNDRNILWGFGVYDRESGDKLIDLTSDWKESIDSYGVVLAYRNGFIRQVSFDPPRSIFVVAGASPKLIPGHLMASLVGPGDTIIGYTNCGVGCQQVSTGQYLWHQELPRADDRSLLSVAGLALVGDRVFTQVFRDGLLCIDASSGEVVWQNQGEAVEAMADAFACDPYDRLIAVNDRVYLIKTGDAAGRLKCFNARTGGLEWERAAPTARASCAVGDLLFLSVDDSLLIALDRYTGEQVWQADDRMGPAYHVVAAGRYVVFSTTTDEIRCFRWEQPYVSPARPAEAT